MKNRKKAQDIFNETEYVFVDKATFEKAFPTIEEISVEIIETGKNVYHSGQPIYYDKKTLGEYINCSNTQCYKGGFRIGRIIQKMVIDNKTDLEDTEFCQGHESSPKGRRIGSECFNAFDYKIHIEYKNKNK